MTRIDRDLMRGAGPLAVLSLLKSREMYGYELVESLAARSQGVLDMGQATLYPMLYNLEAKGLVEATWETAESGRERKYYRLTGAGRKKLQADEQQWKGLVAAMSALGVGARLAAEVGGQIGERLMGPKEVLS
jgi:PadR family transcriptional regulator, regulatory protein PadR